MKKLTFVAAATIAAATLVGCGNSMPKANLKTDVDTLSYAVGLAQTQGLREYLVGRMGIDTTYIDQFIKGLNDGVNSGDDKKKAAYFAGIQIGQQVSNQMIPGINHEIYGEDSTKTISLKNFMAGFIAGATNGKALMTPEEAQNLFQTKMQVIKAKVAEETYGANKQAGVKYLAENAKKEGVKTLEVTTPDGKKSFIQYRVIKEGTGALPADTSSVKVNYEGKTIDGNVFDSSYKRNEPVTMRANQVIKGWTAALTHMPVGSSWEVFIPQELAYGERAQGPIKPFSALIFKIDLLGIEK